MALVAPDPHFKARVKSSFDRQRIMTTIGATLTRIEAGEVEISLPYRNDLTQQHGFVHAGIVATIADSACGYAAFSLMPAKTAVLTVEYKINLLRPASGETFVARAHVLRPGKTITVCRADVYAASTDGEKLVATMLGTIAAVPEREGVVG